MCVFTETQAMIYFYDIMNPSLVVCFKMIFTMVTKCKKKKSKDQDDPRYLVLSYRADQFSLITQYIKEKQEAVWWIAKVHVVK